MATEERKLRWDTCQIAQDQAKHLVEEGEYEDEDKAFQDACADSDLYEMEWEYLCECLTEWMKEINPDGSWDAEVTGFGWRRLSGRKALEAGDGRTLLLEILPRTECTFTIHHRGDHIALENAHHDAPTGGEWYHIRPRAAA